jgi:hypothetical protein
MFDVECSIFDVRAAAGASVSENTLPIPTHRRYAELNIELPSSNIDH